LGERSSLVEVRERSLSLYISSPQIKAEIVTDSVTAVYMIRACHQFTEGSIKKNAGPILLHPLYNNDAVNFSRG